MSTYSIGTMNQLGDALERAGFTTDDVTKLRGFMALPSIREVLNAHARVSFAYFIDLSKDPFVPTGWEVIEHKKEEKSDWDPDKVQLFHVMEQTSHPGSIEGHALKKRLARSMPLNANMLDFLLAHPDLLPFHWRVLEIFFWGTIYRHTDGGACVRCLRWIDHEWNWDFRGLDGDFDDICPAAVYASS